MNGVLKQWEGFLEYTVLPDLFLRNNSQCRSHSQKKQRFPGNSNKGDAKMYCRQKTVI
jgi:hypothetical protein